MKILTIADVVVKELYEDFNKKDFTEIDLVLACGDLPPEYLTFLYDSLNVPVYYVRGNHDIRHDLKPPLGCMNIHSKIVKINNLKIMGLEGSLWYNGGPYQYTEKQMKKIIRSLKLSLWWNKGIDIVITHAPPRHIHDGNDLCHMGFDCYRKLIDTYRPDYFIHGHIHSFFETQDERITIVDNTKVMNTYGYSIIEINDIQVPE